MSKLVATEVKLSQIFQLYDSLQEGKFGKLVAKEVKPGKVGQLK
ncbi:hypothetical protein GMJAKD_01480 [Candidatus Electrothrix aarhusensis]